MYMCVLWTLYVSRFLLKHCSIEIKFVFHASKLFFCSIMPSNEKNIDVFYLPFMNFLLKQNLLIFGWKILTGLQWFGKVENVLYVERVTADLFVCTSIHIVYLTCLISFSSPISYRKRYQPFFSLDVFILDIFFPHTIRFSLYSSMLKCCCRVHIDDIGG